MRISVKINEPLAARAKAAGGALEVAEGACVGDVIAQVGLRPGDVGPVLRNDRLAAGMQEAMAEGDRIEIYPVIGGG